MEKEDFGLFIGLSFIAILLGISVSLTVLTTFKLRDVVQRINKLEKVESVPVVPLPITVILKKGYEE